MTFHNVSFPTKTIGGQEVSFFEYGSGGGGAFAGAQFDSGAQRSHRVLRSEAPRDQWQLRAEVMGPDDANTLHEFWLARRGPFAAFRFKDFHDCKSHSAGRLYNTTDTITDQDHVIGTGDGTTTQFQLRKGYGPSAYRIWRNITKPIAGTVVVALDGVSQASGWSVNTETGIITFTTAPGSNVQVTAGFEFEKVVRFRGDFPGGAMQRIAQGFDVVSVPGFGLIEEPDETPEHDAVPHGGSYTIPSMTESVSLSIASGRLVRLGPSVASLSAYLPDATDVGYGTDYFLILNTGSETLTVRNHQGNSVTTIGSSAQKRLHIQAAVSGTGYDWLVTDA